MSRVRILWWANRVKGDSTRWNKECFEEAGAEVEVITDDLTRVNHGADMVFSPVPGLPPGEIPKVTQFGGYGKNLVLPDSPISRRAEFTFKYSDAVTILDPNMLFELRRVGLDESTVMVPNAAPPITVPPEQSGKFRVLYPSGISWYKKSEKLIEAIRLVGKREPRIEFVMPTVNIIWRGPIEWLEIPNLKILPRQDMEGMLDLYAKSDIVFPFSYAEILPQTIFEGFIAGKPIVANKMGMIQSVHRDNVAEMCSDFGESSENFHEKWENRYFSGESDHFVRVSTPEEAADAIIGLYEDEQRRLELGLNAQEWVDNYSENWSMEDRGRTLMEVGGL